MHEQLRRLSGMGASTATGLSGIQFDAGACTETARRLALVKDYTGWVWLIELLCRSFLPLAKHRRRAYSGDQVYAVLGWAQADFLEPCCLLCNDS
jgi:hypothetical protein